MTWNVDPAHTTIEFAVKHMIASTVRARFTKYTVEAAVDETNLGRSAAAVTIDAASVESGNDDRDAHLRSADFLDTENYPVISFHTKRLEAVGGDEYRLTGDLTVRGVTREVQLEGEAGGPVTDPWGGTRVALTVEGKVNRKDFGMNWDLPLGLGRGLVGDNVKLSVSLELVKAA